MNWAGRWDYGGGAAPLDITVSGNAVSGTFREEDEDDHTLWTFRFSGRLSGREIVECTYEEQFLYLEPKRVYPTYPSYEGEFYLTRSRGEKGRCKLTMRNPEEFDLATDSVEYREYNPRAEAWDVHVHPKESWDHRRVRRYYDLESR